MGQLPNRVLWLVALWIAVLAIAGVLTTLTLRAVSPEPLSDPILVVVWINVGFQLLLLSAAIYIASRILRSDRLGRAAEARKKNLSDLALLSGGLAHEMRNHLHTLRSRIGLLRKATRDDQTTTTRVEKLDEIVQAMEDMLNDFLTFARPATDDVEKIDTAKVIKSVVEFEALDLERANVKVELDLHAVHLWIDRRKLQRALLNLVVNARQAMPIGGTLRIECRRNQSFVQIVVRDTGEGISPDDLPHVFESYFTTKGDGTGLGLAIVRRTVEDFGGRVSCSSQVGAGTSFTIELPVCIRKDTAESTAQGAKVGEGSSG